MILKVKSSPLAIKYRKDKGMSKQEFDKRFDKDLVSIVKAEKFAFELCRKRKEK